MDSLWRTKAACRGTAAENILPVLCFNACPVRKQCLREALDESDWHRGVTYEPYYVWGGHSASARFAAMQDTGFRAANAFDLLIGKEKTHGPAT